MREPTPNEVAAALVAVEIDASFADRNGVPLIEETIGPSEVFSAPEQPEYTTVSRKIWVDTCTRCLDNELRAARLQEQVDALQLQIEAHEVVGAAKDTEMDDLDETIKKLEDRITKAAAKMAVLRYERDWWRRYALIADAVATVAATALVALAAKNVGWM